MKKTFASIFSLIFLLTFSLALVSCQKAEEPKKAEPAKQEAPAPAAPAPEAPAPAAPEKK